MAHSIWHEKIKSFLPEHYYGRINHFL
ncbi:TPA: uracil-DNA glycosylase, partial [Streptococcus pyogenes]|nr:uracil-DNA glycosylase [Streptococcus pyogenes]